MMNNNKILTVSYGTFSCTLEGFDDSFGTMKAIAEYFRDLAADDRYFGAEPPQPDAEMLARIAEREVSRRVEAREHEGRIMLKAHEEPATESTAASVAAAAVAAPIAEQAIEELVEETQSVDTAEQQEERAVAETTDAPEAEAADALEFETEAPETTETVAEEETPETVEVTQPEQEIAEIADVPEVTVEEMAFEAAEEEMTEEAPGEEETQVAEVASVEEDMPIEVAPPEVDAAELDEEEAFESDEAQYATTEAEAEETEVESAAAFFAQSIAAESADMGTEEDISTDAFAPVDDSAMLVEEFEAEEVETHTAEFAGESLAEKLQRIRDVVSRQDDEAVEAHYVEDEDEATPVMGFDEVQMPLVQDSMDAAPENDAMAEAAQDITDALALDDATETVSETIASEETDELDMILRRIEADDEDREEHVALDLSEEFEDDEPTENLFAEQEDQPEENEIHGRVLKVSRADLEAALDSGDLEEYVDTPEAETAEDTATDDADEAPVVEEATAARESLPEINGDSDADLSRLMAEADHQMQEPEGKTRRSAFAHLRAAVAARFADRSMEEEAEQNVEEAAEAYRSDLADVVKPRRPKPLERTERPTDTRPAPLKLVAEQRIDGEDAAPRGPVSPRRVAASTESDFDLNEDTGFAAYAEEHDAKSLTEILEAAAAYLSFVEGHEQFSRPQLMSRVRQADCGEFTREDGLRSFGQLLRTGKIEKIKGGRFTASEAIGYKPDHRAVG